MSNENFTRIVLRERDSAGDLVLRGYHRDEVSELTGIDVGYNANSIKKELVGIDRWAYKLAHVEQRIDDQDIEEAIAAYGQGGFGVEGVLAALGLRNPTLVKLKKLFVELDGGRWAGVFAEADRRHRRGNMSRGMVDKHGIDNPFKLDEVQERAKATRKDRYGAEYTLATGSSLAEGARRTMMEKTPASESGDVLLTEGSPEDLAGRGYRSREIKELTGTTDSVKSLSATLVCSRGDYMVAHVRRRIGRTEFRAILEEGLSLAETTDRLGIMVGQGVKTTISLSALCTRLGMVEEYEGYRRMRGQSSMAAMHDGVRARYGVENISQLAEIKEKKKATTLRNYGADHYLKTEEGRARHRATVREHYGVDNVSQAAEVKARKAATSMANYGVSSFLETESCQESLLDALAKTYGEEAVALAVVEAGGDRSAVRTFMVAGVLEAAAKRTSELYGVANVFELDDVQEKIRATMVERYGVNNPSLVPEFQAKRLETFREVFGADNPYQNEEVKDRIRETNLSRYGVAHPAMTDAVKAKVMATNMERLGVPYTMQSEQVRKRGMETKRAKGTFSTSSSEEDLFGMLTRIFGQTDVKRQYADPRYDFACDFYIPSRDMFIELNGSWTHGQHWYSAASEADRAVTADWSSRGGDYYDNALSVWTQRDVSKRAAAAEHELNYVTLWDSDELLDAKLWIAMGCPDGRDWGRRYSWLPDRSLDLDVAWPELNEKSRSATAIARRANWREFYARELDLWEKNPVSPRKWGTVQARLYANRLEHMGAERGTGKLPGELSDLEILRGMGISGVVRAFTVFDNTGMRAVLDEYAPSGVYDPCAGWGERLVTCATRGIAYEGTDINSAVAAGHAAIVEHYGLTEQATVCGDAASRDMRAAGHEMVFTCPPYGGIEKYTDAGAEQLDDEEFVAWWSQVVAMSTSPSTTVFAYQINEAWRSRLNQVLLDAGWQLTSEISMKGRSSHFTRGKGGVNRKRERESIQVFTR